MKLRPHFLPLFLRYAASLAVPLHELVRPAPLDAAGFDSAAAGLRLGMSEAQSPLAPLGAPLGALPARVLAACNLARCDGGGAPDGVLRFSGSLPNGRVLVAVLPGSPPTLRVNCDDGMASTTLLDFVKRALLA